jgi:hypothetical protein
MKWISNGDPPLYVWKNDWWYNQKDKQEYQAMIKLRQWISFEPIVKMIDFPKKTRIMTND